MIIGKKFKLFEKKIDRMGDLDGLIEVRWINLCYFKVLKLSKSVMDREVYGNEDRSNL